ncbi:Protoporphyrinogen oxidase [Delitschia confertaspora ATCC 74209]|uniref:Protoporphyrinogen oxidase n=1 Tax=Delitschia confertaspora ATCC 74209 TaxID=1513339 RepID=A0A9P4MNH7_9PLEO|nr:Protoporphyrinogen oxidase [Delitschia confertaspora ATCC 74209]
MTLTRHAQLVQSAVKRTSAHHLLPGQLNRSRYSSSAAYPERIAVVGGGISGLASAYFISKEFPKSKITIYEASNRLGGWIQSKHVDVPNGNVLFEAGPRTLRVAKNAAPTIHLIEELGLINDVIFTSKTSPAAQNRYIFYPDRLQKLPNKETGLLELLKLFSSGLLDGVLPSLLEFSRPQRPSNVDDETVESFLSRRFDKRVAQNLFSAVFHGIYAGDIKNLSAKTLLPLFWELERSHKSILRGFAAARNSAEAEKYQDFMTFQSPYDAAMERAMAEELKIPKDQDFAAKLKEASTFGFRGGMGQLIQHLEKALRANKNISIKLNQPVDHHQHMRALKGMDGDRVVLGTLQDKDQSIEPHSNAVAEKSDLVILSTIPKGFVVDDFATVMTVNLYYPNPDLLPVRGFGYLIPQSVAFHENPERALGVIFDSDAITGQDTVRGTKVTVMLGGHYWRDWQHYPTEEEGTTMARSLLERHLGIKETPVASYASLNRDCIPQYTPLYEERMRQYANTYLLEPYDGRVRIVGNQVNGVGINDCIQGAWFLALKLRGNGWKEKQRTGAERFFDNRPWQVVPVNRNHNNGSSA